MYLLATLVSRIMIPIVNGDIAIALIWASILLFREGNNYFLTGVAGTVGSLREGAGDGGTIPGTGGLVTVLPATCARAGLFSPGRAIVVEGRATAFAMLAIPPSGCDVAPTLVFSAPIVGWLGITPEVAPRAGSAGATVGMAIGLVLIPPEVLGTLPATGIFSAARAACMFFALGPAGVAGAMVGSVRCSTWSLPKRTYTSANMIRHPIISSVLVSFICLNVIFFYRVLNN
jgi:hypothetical protein